MSSLDFTVIKNSDQVKNEQVISALETLLEEAKQNGWTQFVLVATDSDYGTYHRWTDCDAYSIIGALESAKHKLLLDLGNEN